MLLCQLVVSVPCTLIVLGLLVTSSARRRHPKYWIALVCSAQAMPLVLVLRDIGQSSPHFCTIWLVSMSLVLAGFVALAVWPNKGDGA
jgi:hypothetical protein